MKQSALIIATLLCLAMPVQAETVRIPLVWSLAPAGACTFTDVGDTATLPNLNLRFVVAGLQTVIIYPCEYDGWAGEVTLAVSDCDWESGYCHEVVRFGAIGPCDGSFVLRRIAQGTECALEWPVLFAYAEDGQMIGMAEIR